VDCAVVSKTVARFVCRAVVIAIGVLGSVRRMCTHLVR
jgi:hypothetical protein